ncbi:MAG: DnaB-like helicase C-terminal domain-containing protein [Candidatus Gastranaerophilales bacterium]|nr:DnaB-like helicase C-terminal domain-containing protein [Candidatus Gastranaerophilales bacterium]
MKNKEILEKAYNKTVNKNEYGIKTGFESVDMILSDIENGSLITIASRRSIGKKAFAMTLMENFIKNNKKCLYFSLETSEEQFAKRLLAQYAEISLSRSFTNRLRDVDIVKLDSALQELSGLDFDICDKTYLTVDEIENRVYECDPDYVFVDYLQLMSIPDGVTVTRVDIFYEIMKGLKNIAKDKGIIIFVLSQLSKAIETRKDKHPILSDLREFGLIEEISDVVIFIHKEEYYDPNKRGESEIIFAKNKFGSVITTYLLFSLVIDKFVQQVIS